MAEQSEGKSTETLSGWFATAAKPVFAGVVLVVVASVTSAFLVSRDNASRLDQLERDVAKLEKYFADDKQELQKFMDPGGRFTNNDGSRLSARIDTNSLLIRELAGSHNSHLQRGERYIAEIERLKEDMKTCLSECCREKPQYQFPNHRQKSQ